MLAAAHPFELPMLLKYHYLHAGTHEPVQLIARISHRKGLFLFSDGQQLIRDLTSFYLLE